MGILEFFEPEEFVGKHWARFIGNQASYPRHPDAAVKFNDIRDALGVYFRALGGDAGLELSAAMAKARSHRLNLKMKLGMDEERIENARRDSENLILPTQIDFFADEKQNRKLYFWLAAFMAEAMPPLNDVPKSGFRGDIHAIRQALITTRLVLKKFPGLRPHYLNLSTIVAKARPKRPLPDPEKLVEDVLQSILINLPPANEAAKGLLDKILTGRLDDLEEPLSYRPFLPIPLWGEATQSHPRAIKNYPDEDMDEEGETKSQDARDGRKRKASKKESDQADKDDPLIMNRFEKVISVAEMVNINAAIDDDADDNAKKAADDLDEITLSKNKRKVATKVKFDLDLPPDAVDETRLIAETTYPEWDYRKKIYHPDHCVVFAGHASEEGADWHPDKKAQQRIRRVRKQFEALRPKREIVHRQLDGQELDIDAVIRSRCDFAAMGEGSDQIFTSFRNQARDLATAILIDTSLSTDGWVDDRRVLDVEKEALTTLTHGLTASGDDHAIFSFSSRKRSFVKVDRLKDFDEPLSPIVNRRIAALKPGYYTRMGAAIRHVAKELEQRPNRHKLLLIIGDGKPNDLDHYEGRYGIEDTRKAIQEVRGHGMAAFGVTIDVKAQDYFPYLFGRGGCAIVPHIDNLSAALPGIFRQLTC